MPSIENELFIKHNMINLRLSFVFFSEYKDAQMQTQCNNEDNCNDNIISFFNWIAVVFVVLSFYKSGVGKKIF